MTGETLSEAQLEQRRRAGFQDEHGGAGAVRSIQQGRPFRGLAAQEEAQVIEDLESLGRVALVKENAVRLQTATRLYWGAVQKAADDGDLKKLDSFIARFGWLAGSALRAWAQVKAEGGDDDGGLLLDAMAAAKAAKGER